VQNSYLLFDNFRDNTEVATTNLASDTYTPSTAVKSVFITAAQLVLLPGSHIVHVEVAAFSAGCTAVRVSSIFVCIF